MENLVKGFKEHPTFRFTTLLVVLLIALIALAPVLAPYNPLEAVMKDANQAPSMAHLFGTDKLGRDVLSRMLYGGAYSLASVRAVVAIIFCLGTFLGLVAGYFGGIIDTVIMRVADMMISFPGVILAIAIAGIMGGSLVNAMIALTAVAEKENAAETLLQARGFADPVVSLTDGKVDVVINAPSITDQQRAQIEDIVKRKTEVSAENIIITLLNLED